MIQPIGMNQGRFWETAPKQKSGSGGFWELFQAEQAKGMTAGQYLSTLTPDDLAIPQKESRLAAPINIAKISEEGARNLPAEGDQSKFVDLNNDTVKRIIDNLERSLKYREPAEQQITRWEMDVLSDFLQNIQQNYAADQSKAINEPGANNPSIWDELSQKYDIRRATFDELCSISYQLYQAKQITLRDHATLSFDPTRIPHTAGAKFYFTPAAQDGRRDWIAEYTARAEFELKNGNPDGYRYIMNHFVNGILGRLERKQTLTFVKTN